MLQNHKLLTTRQAIQKSIKIYYKKNNKIDNLKEFFLH